MHKKQWSILIIVLTGIVIIWVSQLCLSSKVTVAAIEESVQEVPLTIESINLILEKIDKNGYLTKDQMTHRGKNFVKPFIHDEECKLNCRKYHTDKYEIKTDFKKFDKKLEIIGTTKGIPYHISLHNRKAEKYYLYYQMTMPITEENNPLRALQGCIDEVESSIELTGKIKGEISGEQQKAYVSQILHKLDIPNKEEDKVTISEEEEIYYGYMRSFKTYEKNGNGNKFNVIIRFVFDPITQQTQLVLKLPIKI